MNEISSARQSGERIKSTTTTISRQMVLFQEGTTTYLFPSNRFFPNLSLSRLAHLGGAKWEGKKTVIQDDDEPAEGVSADTTYEGSPTAEEAPSSPSAAPAAAAPGAVKSFKYAKIVRKLLRQVSRLCCYDCQHSSP